MNLTEEQKALRLADALEDQRMVVFWDQRTKAAAELRRLHAENEALRKDAERYRWIESAKGLELRADGSTWKRADGTPFIASHVLCVNGSQYAGRESLNAAIDAAMGEES